MPFPTLDEVVAELRRLADTELEIDPDTPIIDVDVDSMDVIEWLYVIEEENDIVLDEIVITDFESMTLRTLYDEVVRQYEFQRSDRESVSN